MDTSVSKPFQSTYHLFCLSEVDHQVVSSIIKSINSPVNHPIYKCRTLIGTSLSREKSDFFKLWNTSPCFCTTILIIQIVFLDLFRILTGKNFSMKNTRTLFYRSGTCMHLSAQNNECSFINLRTIPHHLHLQGLCAGNRYAPGHT